MLAVDILLVIIQLSLKNIFPVYLDELIELLTLLFCAYFCGEVVLRLIGQGYSIYLMHHLATFSSLSVYVCVCRLVFFKRWFEVFDLAVIILSSCLTIIFILIDSAVDNSDGKTIIS